MSMGYGGIFGYPKQGEAGMGNIFRPGSQRGLFGNPMEMAEQMAIPQRAPELAAQIPPEQAQEKRWMDGGKFKFKDGLALALGAIGDAFTGQPMAARMVANRGAAEREAQMMQAKRQQDMEDQIALLKWKRENPEPQEAPALQRNIEYLEQKYGPDMAREYVMKPTFVQNWDGTRTQVGGAPSLQAGHEEDGYVFKGGDPADPNAWAPKGGGVSNGPGGFPR